MALQWRWKAIDPRGKWTLPLLIQQLNIRLGQLTDTLKALFSSIEAVDTFPAGAATPSIYGSTMWQTNNPSATSYTNFLDGAPGKTFTLWAGDANSTVVNNANIKTKSGANIVMTATDVRTFATANGLLWRET